MRLRLKDYRAVRSVYIRNVKLSLSIGALGYSWLFLLLALLSACQPSSRDVFILPVGFSGRVVIFFEQPDGEAEKVAKGERVFTIPKSGVLSSQATVADGWAALPGYYHDSISESTRIPVRIDWKDYRSDSLNASLMSVGSFERGPDHVRVRFGEFFVGSKEQIEAASREAQTKLTSALLP